MKFYIPPQLTRLAIAFALFITLFLILRKLLIPDTFGQYGHYRGDSLKDNELVPINYAGEQACFKCHQDIEDLKQTDLHSEISCETCHGPGQKHSESAKAADILKPGSREFCGVCHDKNAAKSRDAIFQVKLSEHNINKQCTECHNAHQPWTMKE